MLQAMLHCDALGLSNYCDIAGFALSSQSLHRSPSAEISTQQVHVKGLTERCQSFKRSVKAVSRIASDDKVALDLSWTLGPYMSH